MVQTVSAMNFDTDAWCDECIIADMKYVMEKPWTYIETFVQDACPSPKAKEDPAVEYAFTLTMPPNYKTREEMEKACENVLRYGLSSRYEKATQCAYVVEYTDNMVPHIHGVYTAPHGRRILQKYFHRYWKLWDEKKKMGHGHQGGYHAKARHSESYSAYMAKEGVKQFIR